MSCPINREREKRRAVLLSLLAGGMVGIKTLPERWTRPVVDHIVLPAHAQPLSECEPADSGDGGEVFDDCPEDDFGP